MESKGPLARERGEVTPGRHGVDLILRFADGEQLSAAQREAMRAAMYLIVQYARPARNWRGFRWQGVEHFMLEIWPQVQGRRDIFDGLFGDGATSP